MPAYVPAEQCLIKMVFGGHIFVLLVPLPDPSLSTERKTDKLPNAHWNESTKTDLIYLKASDRWTDGSNVFLGGWNWWYPYLKVTGKENVECMPEHTVHLLLVVMEERLCISHSVIWSSPLITFTPLPSPHLSFRPLSTELLSRTGQWHVKWKEVVTAEWPTSFCTHPSSRLACNTFLSNPRRPICKRLSMLLIRRHKEYTL